MSAGAGGRGLAPCVFRAVVTGGSAGGTKALATILAALPADFALPVLVVQHLPPGDDEFFVRNLASVSRLPVVAPCDKERLEPGWVYTAPANYHLLLERDGSIALSVDQRVNWSRPAVDVLFESAAAARGEKVIAVILSGANADGAAGVRAIKAAGGLTIAQDPDTAEQPIMPQAAIATGAVDEVLRVEAIGPRLTELSRRQKKGTYSLTEEQLP